jgi:8-oxo-dGTP pyrophosphatase MutT (NUDIX family)
MNAEPTPIIPAATILLVRDIGEPGGGFEVAMIERTQAARFAGGALVFPGGKVDAADESPFWEAHGAAGMQGALRVAAAREAYEETGLLLARQPLTPAQIATAVERRAAVAADATLFRPLVEELNVLLDLEGFHHFAHWITPEAEKRRFDTHFYIAHAPLGQDIVHDGGEAVDAVWLRPQDALEAGAKGERQVMFPTRLNLELLAASSNAKSAIADTLSRTVHTILPIISFSEGGASVSIPEGAGYVSTSEVFRSPTKA